MWRSKKKQPPPQTFDPAAWLEEYEAIGGKVYAVHRSSPEDSYWLGSTLDGDVTGRGNELRRQLNAPAESEARNRALFDYVVNTRGVMEVPGAVYRSAVTGW